MSMFALPVRVWRGVVALLLSLLTHPSGWWLTESHVCRDVQPPFLVQIVGLMAFV